MTGKWDLPDKQGDHDMPDMHNASFEDMKLQVGARLQLMLHRSRKTIYYSSLIGYAPGEYLLVKVPMEKGLSVPILEGEAVTVREFSGMAVYTFDSVVESVQLNPHFYMHLSFPTVIQATPLRDAPRVRVSLAAQVRPASGEPTQAVLSNLSISGTYIMAASELGKPGDAISIAFSFPLKPTNQEVRLEVAGAIRSSQRIEANGTPGGYGIGVHFDNVAPNDQVMLQHYLYEAEEHAAHHEALTPAGTQFARPD